MIFKNIQINKLINNQRLDNFIIKTIKTKNTQNIYKLIKKKCILLNKKKTKNNYKMKTNDIINIISTLQFKQYKNNNTIIKVNNLLQNILYENINFIIINKPAGLSVHNGTKITYNIINILRSSKKFHNSYLELAHRLDKETSGCLLIAKNREFLLKIHELYKQKKIKKTYHALVAGITKKNINIKIKQKNLMIFNKKLKDNNNDTITEIKTIKNFNNHSLIQIKPITGKIHQIRIHLSYIGHPVIGDNKYGSLMYNKKFNTLKINTLYLHSTSIAFTCPISKKKIYIKNPCTWKFNNFNILKV